MGGFKSTSKNVFVCTLAVLWAAWSAVAHANEDANVPRFESIKWDRVNVRNGPGMDHSIKWVYLAPSYPVEVKQETDEWRLIEDVDGQQGWIYHQGLTDDRTLLVVGNGRDKLPVALREEPKLDASIVAAAQIGVIVSLKECKQQWCLAVVKDTSNDRSYQGWLHRSLVWGHYPD